MIWVSPEKGPPQPKKEERLLSGPLEKIGSSMTMIFKLRVGGTVAVDRSAANSRWAGRG
jgi:hypothetical protein